MKPLYGCITAAVILSIAVASLPAFAQTGYYGRLTTVVETYKTVEGEHAVPFYQYLNLTVDQPMGIEREHYLYFYGRLSEDLLDHENKESEVYSAFLNMEEVLPRTGLTLGRQFISTVAGSAVTDGIEVRINEMARRLKVGLFAGGDAKFVDKYEEGDWLFGGTLDILHLDRTNVGFSFFQKYDRWDVARQALGLDLGYRIRTLAKVHAEARYDLLTEMVDTYFLGGKLYAGRDLTLSLEYYYNVPVFDATDIYSVFAVDEYREARFQADYRISKWINVFGAYTHEFYEEGEDTDNIEFGTIIRRYKDFDLYASALFREGEDDLIGGTLKGHYFATNDLTIGAGIEGDDYRMHDPEESKSASRYFADVMFYLSNHLYVYGKVEGLKSEYHNHEIRARIKVSYAFQRLKGKGQ